MFDLVRKHTKVLMFLMFLLIIPAFVLVGVDGYSRLNNHEASRRGREHGRRRLQRHQVMGHRPHVVLGQRGQTAQQQECAERLLLHAPVGRQPGPDAGRL